MQSCGRGGNLHVIDAQSADELHPPLLVDHLLDWDLFCVKYGASHWSFCPSHALESEYK